MDPLTCRTACCPKTDLLDWLAPPSYTGSRQDTGRKFSYGGAPGPGQGVPGEQGDLGACFLEPEHIQSGIWGTGAAWTWPASFWGFTEHSRMGWEGGQQLGSRSRVMFPSDVLQHLWGSRANCGTNSPRWEEPPGLQVSDKQGPGCHPQRQVGTRNSGVPSGHLVTSWGLSSGLQTQRQKCAPLGTRCNGRKASGKSTGPGSLGGRKEGSARDPGWWGEECYRLTLDKTAPVGECTLFLNCSHLQAKRPFALSSP